MKPMKRWYWIVAALVSVGVVVALLLTRAPYLDFALLLLTDIDEIDLSAYERVLIISPHTDDELLGAAGLMQAAKRQGLEVRVVIATNGDGQLVAALRDFRRLFPNSDDFVRMGFLRQQESLLGLRVLGIRPDMVSFLSYPDAGLSALWQNHWLASAPYYSPYSHSDSSPYPLTYNPTAVYAGTDLLDDLCTILEDQRPDLILFPHPSDQHADHRSLSVFTRLAVAVMQQQSPTYQPDMLAYLVHYDGYPYPRKLRLDDRTLPPPRLMEVTPEWVQVSLEPEDLERKLTALRMHRSQYPSLRNLLESFARTNEIYARIPTAQVLPALAWGEVGEPATWRTADDERIGPVLVDPVGDFQVQDRIWAGDLTAVYAAVDAEGLLTVSAEVRGRVTATLNYAVRVSAVNADGVVVHHVARYGRDPGYPRASASRRTVYTQVSLEALGDPWLLFVSADVTAPGMGTVDSTIWEMIALVPLDDPGPGVALQAAGQPPAAVQQPAP